MTLYHRFDVLESHGLGLAGYQVICRLPGGGAVQPIFSDINGTPIIAVSGITNAALTDSEGNFSYFVASGSVYDEEYYTPNGVFVFATRSIPMLFGPKGDKGDTGAQGAPGTGSGSGFALSNHADIQSYLTKLNAGSAPTTIETGDSTTNNTGQYPAYYGPLAQSVGAAAPSLSGMTGQDTGQWLAQWLPGEINANVDLLIWGWGINDIQHGISLAQSEANLRSGLTQYRNSRPVATNAIVLMTPNACVDNGTLTDATLSAYADMVKRVAPDFNCAVWDRFNAYRDAFALNWSDSIHPKPAFAQAIGGDLFEAIHPYAVRSGAGSSGSNVGTKANTDAPATYPAGYSYGISGAGMPSTGILEQVLDSTYHAGTQILSDFSNQEKFGMVQVRVAGASAGVSTGFSRWGLAGSSKPFPVTPTGGYAAAGDATAMMTQVMSGAVMGYGKIVQSAPAPVAAMTKVGQIDTTLSRPPTSCFIPLVYTNNNNDFHEVVGRVDPNGSIYLVNAITENATFLFLAGQWPSASA